MINGAFLLNLLHKDYSYKICHQTADYKVGLVTLGFIQHRIKLDNYLNNTLIPFYIVHFCKFTIPKMHFMTPLALVNEIQSYCKANPNEALVKKYSRFFREGYNAYGLSTELLTIKVSEIINQEGIDLKTIEETSFILVSSEMYEEVSFAVLLLREFRKQFTADTFGIIERWFEQGITNWAHTDVICSELIATFLEKKIITFNRMADWRNAPNKFQRRAVPVALIKMLKYTNDYQAFFNFIEPMMMDAEREVHQGLGWFLREAWKKSPEQTEMFMMQWKDNAPRLIFQYATERMKPEQKQHFKRSKGSR
jgi:3-methyladenine DNA glycosylase AlkD